MKALSLSGPYWPWLMVNGHKRIENRVRPTNFRGQFLIHAAKSVDNDNTQFVYKTCKKLGITLPDSWQPGGICGIATLVDCVTESSDPWFFGPYGYILEDARPLPFIPCKGALGFWDVPEEIIRQVALEQQ